MRIAHAVNASEEGALLIIGGAGSGKSTCLELAAVDSPLATVTLRVNPAEVGWALAGLDALLCLIGDGIHEQAVRDFVPSVQSTTPLVDTARATLEVVRSLGLSPLVALIDDIDQMDEASQVIIGFLVSRLHHTNLRIIATASAEHPLSNVGRMDAVHLGDMDVCDLSAIALHLLGETADRGGVVALARYAGGNPRALTQLGMQLSPAEVRGTAALSLPPRATAIATNLATQRCADLSTASRAMLTRLAAAPVAPLAVMVRTATFWVGEIFDPHAEDGSERISTYDSQWFESYGGCDGLWHGDTCATEARSAADHFFPTAMTPRENPFYLDLPFDDINDERAFAVRDDVVPWASQAPYSGHRQDRSFSYLKNRWVEIDHDGAVCFGQIQDAGPGEYHDAAYVFGHDDARPANTRYGGAGLDVSPALTGCLGFAELDGQSAIVSWRFVDADDVPDGPWSLIVTTRGVR